MAQLYDLSSGSLLLDGHDISGLSKEDISANITMIAQHPFIFSGTLRDNLLYAVRAVPEEVALPSLAEMIRVIDDVGLSEDILRFGFNAVLDRERVAPLKHKLLRMRQIMIHDLGDLYDRSVEIYDASRFLAYSTLRDNLIFGDSLSGRYRIERMVRDPGILALLRQTDLLEELIQLGLTVAHLTVQLLGDLDQDEFFFRDNPMRPEEFPRYRDLVHRLDGRVPEKQDDREQLLILALRIIPARHTIARLPPGLDKKILAFRDKFLHDKEKVDLKRCCHGLSNLQMQQNITALPEYEEEKDFIAYCPAEYLYSHTLRDNILFGAMKHDIQENQELIQRALELFRREGLLDEILDIGLDFDAGSQGDRLSGGQKQKLAIARAFLKPSRILIMDEATASLDNTSQARIQQVLEEKYRGRTTVISVIHRLDLCPAYDRIIVLKNGAIIEQGSHEELMRARGAFHELAQAN